MPSTTYEFTARAKQTAKRPQLMSVWALAGFAVLVMIPLVMIFPKQSLLREASEQRLGDTLTINYLINLLRAEPDNLELRLLLAAHKIHLGETEGVAELIQPALDSADPVWQANGMLSEYRLLFAELHNAEKGSPQRAALMARSMDIFRKISAKSWPLPTLIYLAGQADTLHERGISVLLYRAIDTAAATVSEHWLADNAARVLAQGENELAAHLYFLARHKEYTRAGQRDLLLAGIRALLAGGHYSKAMQAIDEHLGDLEDDDETLYSLVQMARAANDQVRAVRYTKRLLHLSWGYGFLAWVQNLDLSLLGIADADAEALPVAEEQGIRPYDTKKYELAYEVFTGNNKLEDAFRVAEAAVRQVPDDRVWHLRLAQVSEWIGKPAIALREWQWLLRRHETRDAILAVLRLAPGLNNYEALLDAWKRMARLQDLTDEQRENLAGLFEQTGKQSEGARYFEGRYAAKHRAVELEIAARLAERNGDDALALSLYGRLLKEHGAQSGWVLHMANLYLRQSDYEHAYELMHEHRAKADEKDVVYWKLLADLAWQMQKDDEAKNIYRRLQQAGKLAQDDYSRLVYLLDDGKLQERATLAEMAYRHSGDRDMLLLSLEIYAAKQDMVAQKNLFELAATRSDVDWSGTPRFYLMRAQFLQAQGEQAAARADFHRAVALSPDDPGSVNGILWFLIDNHDEAGLREVTGQIVAHGRHKNPVYWGALAAAYQVLGQPSLAVRYYARQLKGGEQDFLWLVNYADALEQAGQAGMADRVRKQAWQKLQARLSGKPVQLPFSADMLAAARLSLLNHPGDPALALMRSVLRQDRVLLQNEVSERRASDLELGWARSLNARDAAAERMVNELVLGWALSTEQAANAKAWLWQRYGQALSRPLWADASLTLAENDHERLGHMLAAQGEGLSLPVRHDAASSLGQTGYAESLAFMELTNEPGSNAAHRRLTEDALAAASFVEAGARSAQIGNLHQHRLNTRLDMPLGRDMRIAFEYARTRQSDDVMQFTAVPGLETVAGVVLKKHGSLGDSEVALRRRNEYASTTELQLKHALNAAPRVSLRFGADYHAEATESVELQEFGMRNRLNAGLLYSIDKRDYLHLEPSWARYYTQQGDALGSGRILSWELVHLFHTEYPDWRVRLIGMHTRFSAAAAAPLLLPLDSNLYGVCGGVGESQRHAYARAWLPYLDYCATHNNQSGQGYNAALGLAGPVVGADRLSLSVGQERGGVNLAYGQSREFNLNYRYFFD